MTWERVMPSLRILATISRSTFSATGADCAPAHTSASNSTRVLRYISTILSAVELPPARPEHLRVSSVLGKATEPASSFDKMPADDKAGPLEHRRRARRPDAAGDRLEPRVADRYTPSAGH